MSDRRIAGHVHRDLALGLGGAVLLRGTMDTLVYGLGTLDEAAYLTAFLALLATTMGACAVPARRASHVDPIAALRTE